MAQQITAFGAAFAATIGHEGSTLDLTASDRGNWTGGEVGSGILRGSKFGVSAASYPTLDIAALTLGDAEGIYRRGYWNPIRGDDLPAPLALMVFDSAVNNGVDAAVRLLQASVGVAQDGVIGPATLAAIGAWGAKTGAAALCAEFLARRIVHMASLPTWPDFALGWARRLAAQPFDAVRLQFITSA